MSDSGGTVDVKLWYYMRIIYSVINNVFWCIERAYLYLCIIFNDYLMYFKSYRFG